MKKLGFLLLLAALAVPPASLAGLSIPLPPIPGINVPVPWAPSPTEVARHAYRYFPDVEVYFDPGRSLYFYMEMNTWRSAPALPTRIVIQGLPWAELKMNDDTPYRYHESVRKHYPPGQAKKMGDGTPPGHSKGKADWKDDKGGKGKGKGH